MKRREEGKRTVNCHTESTLQISSSSRMLLKIKKSELPSKCQEKSDFQDRIFVQDLIIEGYKTILIRPPKLFPNMFPMHEFWRICCNVFPT